MQKTGPRGPMALRVMVLAICLATALFAQPAFSGAEALDREITAAIEHQLIPGAVVEIGHQGAVVYKQAYGSRALIPKREPMTLDTIFDAASLTKVVATTSCLMKLFDEGKIRLNDPGDRLPAGIPGRPQRHYDPEFYDAFLRAAARSRSGAALERL